MASLKSMALGLCALLPVSFVTLEAAGQGDVLPHFARGFTKSVASSLGYGKTEGMAQKAAATGNATAPAGGNASGAPNVVAPAAGGAPRGGAGGAGGRQISVTVAKAVVKSVPVTFEAVSTAVAMASVIVRPRIDSQIDEVMFQDGAFVKAGDVLFKLDGRAVDAQLAQADANLAREKVTLEQARRYVKRDEELVAKAAGTQQRLDESRSAVAASTAAIKGLEAQVNNLKVQLSYYTITAPISGRVGGAGMKKGNIVRNAETTTPLATINQISPIYVSFGVPQRLLVELKDSLAKKTAKVDVTPQGSTKVLQGNIAYIDNAVDTTNGTVVVRASIQNTEEILWPGAVNPVVLTLRHDENVVTVTREAVQTSQTGSFVYVVRDGVAKVQNVTVARFTKDDAIISNGLKADDVVVTSGQLLLVDGARVAPRQGGAS